MDFIMHSQEDTSGPRHADQSVADKAARFERTGLSDVGIFW
jgi:hypothetical protein